MGQYYNILTKKNDKYILYSRSYKLTNGKTEYVFAKLTEHSWINNTTMSCFSNIILRNPTQVAWVGDYTNQYEKDETINGLDYEQMDKLYHLAWDDNVKAKTMEFRPLSVKHLVLVNWDKKQYIYMYDYIEKSTTKDGWCLHPLSLLTALGNGFGGGDYHGINENKIGSWCFDTISFESYDIEEQLKLDGFEKLDIEFKEEYRDEKTKAYLVLFDYSTNDSSGVETYLFDTYEKALNKMQEIIKQEKESNYSWVADAFDKENNINSGYELDTNMDDTIHEEQELWWNITCKNDWYLHNFLDLRIKEIE